MSTSYKETKKSADKFCRYTILRDTKCVCKSLIFMIEDLMTHKRNVQEKPIKISRMMLKVKYSRNILQQQKLTKSIFCKCKIQNS